MRYALVTLITFFTSFSAMAEAINLTCSDARTYGYRFDAGLPEEWGEEKFNSTWIIKYDGKSETALIDGKEVLALPGSGTVILIDYTFNAQSQSRWSYAIHLSSRKVSASQVNVYDMMGAGVKARSVQFKCY